MPPDIEPDESAGNGHNNTLGEEAGRDLDGPGEPLPDAPLRAILEAVLFATEEPITLEDLTELLGEERAAGVEAALEELEKDLAARGGGLRVQRVAGGLRLTTSPELSPWLRELVRQRNRQRLSRAALETLALVAYKQPITAPEIQEIRGVNPNAILGTLLDRRLIRIMGRKKVVGKPFLYGTTKEFLIRFGLNALTDLPSMDEFAAMLEVDMDAAPLEPAELPFPSEPAGDAPSEAQAAESSPPVMGSEPHEELDAELEEE
jgi:segregation and condensation protein B